MDEPFAALDAQSRELMQAELLRLDRRRRPARPWSSSPTASTRRWCSPTAILLLSPRPGRVVEELAVGFPAPALAARPARGRPTSPSCAATSGSACARWSSPTPARTSSAATPDAAAARARAGRSRSGGPRCRRRLSRDAKGDRRARPGSASPPGHRQGRVRQPKNAIARSSIGQTFAGCAKQCRRGSSAPDRPGGAAVARVRIARLSRSVITLTRNRDASGRR